MLTVSEPEKCQTHSGLFEVLCEKFKHRHIEVILLGKDGPPESLGK